MNGFDDFAKDMDQVLRHFKTDLEEYKDAMGYTFLGEVRTEILRQQLVDTRLLVNSFQKGAADNVWTRSRANRTALEVGTSVEYAQYVNDGHWTRNNASFVDPTHYFDIAYLITENILDADLQKKFEQSIRKGFS
ncbi:HK97 gp10 family phage protein [Exiguobacterium sp. s21]|uniref:HK97 gp10 family phage protein n=1 Tax=Exiguobacterium sp. s21 TaxID=2751244 RepID=UPI001BEC224A|nr:HK97 gp10 family phage protein [Exiguobacterium sp. s21]